MSLQLKYFKEELGFTCQCITSTLVVHNYTFLSLLQQNSSPKTIHPDFSHVDPEECKINTATFVKEEAANPDFQITEGGDLLEIELERSRNSNSIDFEDKQTPNSKNEKVLELNLKKDHNGNRGIEEKNLYNIERVNSKNKIDMNEISLSGLLKASHRLCSMTSISGNIFICRGKFYIESHSELNPCSKWQEHSNQAELSVDLDLSSNSYILQIITPQSTVVSDSRTYHAKHSLQASEKIIPQLQESQRYDKIITNDFDKFVEIEKRERIEHNPEPKITEFENMGKSRSKFTFKITYKLKFEFANCRQIGIGRQINKFGEIQKLAQIDKSNCNLSVWREPLQHQQNYQENNNNTKGFYQSFLHWKALKEDFELIVNRIFALFFIEW